MSERSGLAIAARIAARELRGGIRGFYIFLLCLALGVTAIAAVGSVRSAILSGLENDGARLLGGDAELTFTYRYANADELAWMDAKAETVSRVVEFRSLATVGEARALTTVYALDGAYPLYGAVALDPAQPLEQALAGQGAVMAPDLADRLGLAVGDRFTLGTASFTLRARIIDRPDAGGFALGPPTLLRADALAGSGLLAPGTLFETNYRLRLAPGADLAALRDEARAAFDAGGMRWRDRRNGAPGMGRFVRRLSAFLVLVGLAGLAVGGVGVAAAVRAYLAGKVAVIATLKTIGADGRTVFAAYLIQIGVLAAIGVIAGVVLGAALPLALAPLLTDRLPVPADFGVYPAALGEAALYGALSALVFALWPLARTWRIRPASLYRGDAGADGPGAPRGPGRAVALAVLGLLALLVGTAALLSDMPGLTLGTAAGLAATLLALSGAARLLRALARRAGRLRRVPVALRLALGSLSAPGGEVGAVVMSLGLGLSVLGTIGQIDTNLRAAIAGDLPDVAPSYFIVDIQNDQLDGVLTRTGNDPGITRVDTAPMLRGVITAINGRPAQDFAGDHWVLRGDRGVTYAATPPARTVLTAGRWWPPDYAGPPQVSFAAAEGAEMGLSLGDTVTVNILGRDITATITSFREVDFSTAGIGFVMSMNPAALAGAPHTHIATVYSDAASEAALLRDLARAYPNITAIRVREAIARVTQVLRGLAAAVTAGAGAALLTGFLVLIGAAAEGRPARAYETAVLKTLGAGRGQLLGYLIWRSALLGLAAGLVAILAGGLSAWAVLRFVIEADFTFDPVTAAWIVLAGLVATQLAGLAFARQALRARPARILRARD